MEETYLPATVRERIQELLKEHKITQAELSAAIGMSESALSRFLSERTDKIGDEYIIKIADHLNVSTDFILGQTDFPERRNYDIGELGLSYKAAMVLYTREVETDVVNRLLENPRFPEITRIAEWGRRNLHCTRTYRQGQTPGRWERRLHSTYLPAFYSSPRWF